MTYLVGSSTTWLTLTNWPLSVIGVPLTPMLRLETVKVPGRAGCDSWTVSVLIGWTELTGFRTGGSMWRTVGPTVLSLNGITSREDRARSESALTETLNSLWEVA